MSKLFVRRVLKDLPLVAHPIADRFVVMQIARDHGLSSYDASYLSLAIATIADTATHDKKLIAAAKAENIVLLSIGETNR